MKQLSGVRKAVSEVDDTTLTRWVKTDARKTSMFKTAPVSADANRTRFPTRVLAPDSMTRLLVSGHNNTKIGRDVRIGRLKGYRIYVLSLEERATCPQSCLHWLDCYGNASPLAKRVDHTAEDFLPRLDAEVAELMRKHAGAVLIRLHALGDFYSVAYVRFWKQQLEKWSSLHIFGYTARTLHTEIGNALHAMRLAYGGRFMMRVSDGGLDTMATVSIGSAGSCPDNAFVCPEQLGLEHKKINPVNDKPYPMLCATCGLCWSTDKNVAFMSH